MIADADSVPEPAIVPVDEMCMICGLGGPVKPITGTNGVFSASFTTDPELDAGDGVCWRCEYLAGQMDYRRYHWVATSDGIEVIKERPELIDVLLDPPEGPWMVQYKDGSDFLTVLNGWIVAQRLNTSRQHYRMLVDKHTVGIDRQEFAEMVAFGRDLRSREDAPSKRSLIHGPTAGDLSRYDIGRDEYRHLTNDLAGREDWRIAVQLID